MNKKKKQNFSWKEAIPFYRLFVPQKPSKEKLQEITNYYVYIILILSCLLYFLSPFPVSLKYFTISLYNSTNPINLFNITYFKLFEGTKTLPQEYVASTPDCLFINNVWLNKTNTIIIFLAIFSAIPILSQRIVLLRLGR